MTSPGPKPQTPACWGGPMQVLAAGLPLCATSTLKEIFEEANFLNIGPTMHMNRCLSIPPNLRFILEALAETDTQKRRAILYKLFAGCAATSGFPGHLFMKDLIEMYPDAKVVLNVHRPGAKDWALSMQSAVAPFLSWRHRIACFWSVPDRLHYLCEMEFQHFVRDKFGVANVWSEELYDKHNQWVLDICQRKEKDVLVWEPSMGWGPLCRLLDQKEPEVEVPIIHDRDKMEMVVQRRIAIGLKLWTKKIALPVGLCVLGGWGLSMVVSPWLAC
ncbi:hypothetical protein H2200_004089 [Cladophialophora chaetospira]|uniref:Uncharacterized protein n=1 Tax=Cladophialophora chaetospira TaxID=386627 RepID=A0AA38XFM5_9EURO|nr:hypothetical protein H2200_004089 [Cladophialophora chaetospira]